MLIGPEWFQCLPDQPVIGENEWGVLPLRCGIHHKLRLWRKATKPIKNLLYSGGTSSKVKG